MASSPAELFQHVWDWPEGSIGYYSLFHNYCVCTVYKATNIYFMWLLNAQ